MNHPLYGPAGTEPPADRPRIRIEPPRRAHPDDLHHRHPDHWPTIEAGHSVVLYIGFGISTDPEETWPLARRLRRCCSIRIAARTKQAARGARTTLSDLWRAEDLGRVI